MKSKIAMFNLNSKSTFSAILLSLTLMVAALWVSPAAVAAEKKMVKDPTTGKMVSAPEWGGTITYGRVSWAAHSDVWYISGWATHNIGLVNEMLGIGDWGIDRDVWDWRALADPPPPSRKGALAESWETPDDTTIIFNIRQGVRWHDKAPMNSRLLTAKDVEYNWHRLLGLGKFSEAGPSPVVGGLKPDNFESITATDKYTVVFKLKEPDLRALLNLLAHWVAVIYPPEVIEQHGDYKDWRNTVGTGPYELTELVEDSTRTWTKNPDYWAYDEKYPENRLPYVDKVITLFMPDEATRLAALRTGTIDMLGTVGDSQLRSIDQIESLKRTDPEIEVWPFKYRSDQSFFFVGVHRPPWNDIRVRQAMQMAVDRETIVNTFYKGYGNATPQGYIANDMPFGTPFEEWPEEVKKTYRYDPAGAEALLDAAGLTRGADGIRYKTRMAYYERFDPSYAELVAGYWRQIGVVIEIDAGMDWPTIVGATKGDQDTYRMTSASVAIRYRLPDHLWSFHSDSGQHWSLKDPEYDALWDKANAVTTLEEQNRLGKEAIMYTTAKHSFVYGVETPQFQAWQPWVKGYNAEIRLGMGETQSFLARLWIDSELKKAMGH